MYINLSIMIYIKVLHHEVFKFQKVYYFLFLLIISFFHIEVFSNSDLSHIIYIYFVIIVVNEN